MTHPDIGFKIVCQTMMILKCPLLMNGNCLKKSIWKQPEISSKQKIGYNCYYMGNKMLSTLADTGWDVVEQSKSYRFICV